MKHTIVPNTLFDTLLPQLSESELKIYLTIIRQTFGWRNKKTKKRKTRDRITHNQFVKKTGLSRRVISTTIDTLVKRNLIRVSDYDNYALVTPQRRKGKSYLYYEVIHKPVQNVTPTSAANTYKPVQNPYHNKKNYTKESITKGKNGGLQAISNYLI